MCFPTAWASKSDPRYGVRERRGDEGSDPTRPPAHVLTSALWPRFRRLSSRKTEQCTSLTTPTVFLNGGIAVCVELSWGGVFESPIFASTDRANTPDLFVVSWAGVLMRITSTRRINIGHGWVRRLPTLFRGYEYRNRLLFYTCSWKGVEMIVILS